MFPALYRIEMAVFLVNDFSAEQCILGQES